MCFESDGELENVSSIGSDDEREAESDAQGRATAVIILLSPLLPYMPSVDLCIQALRPIVCLGAFLLERQPNSRSHERVAAQHEIIISGVPDATNPKDIRTKVLEIV